MHLVFRFRLKVEQQGFFLQIVVGILTRHNKLLLKIYHN